MTTANVRKSNRRTELRMHCGALSISDSSKRREPGRNDPGKSGDGVVNFQLFEIPGSVRTRLESAAGGFQGACAVSTLWHDACEKLFFELLSGKEKQETVPETGRICAEKVMEQMPPADAEKHYQDYAKFTEWIKATGHFFGANRLKKTAATATTVRVRNGKVLVSDGPFAETKEQFGGYYLIDSGDELSPPILFERRSGSTGHCSSCPS